MQVIFDTSTLEKRILELKNKSVKKRCNSCFTLKPKDKFIDLVCINCYCNYR